MTRPKTAVVVGATNGIGKAISCRLAQEGFRIIAVGRDKEGRESEVMGFLQQCSANSNGIKHEFRPCNAFELSQVKRCAEDIVRDHGAVDDRRGIDALVMTQGMVSLKKSLTMEGNDEKLTLHFWSRAAFANCLMPALRSPSNVAPGGAVVMTVLSGGVHSPYIKYKDDLELKLNYTVPNAANFAGYYTDLFFDKLARRQTNKSVNFVHAAPGD